MNLETIQEMWSKDSIIDPDELHTASLDVARLHSKYFQLYNDLKLLRARDPRRRNNRCITKDICIIRERLNQRSTKKIRSLTK